MFTVRSTFVNILRQNISSTPKLNINSLLINVRNYATKRRFYKKTGILYSNGKYEVTLDQRKLKTPGGSPFVVDSEPLALLVAAEWDAQKTNIVQSSMHMTTLCNTAIDNPNKLTKFDLVNYITNYIDTDAILFQSNEDDELYNLQRNEWDPVIQWFCDKFKVNIQKSRNIGVPMISEETKAIIAKYLLSHNYPAVTGIVYGVDTLKSVILTLAAVERHLSAEKAVLLSRLEEEFQLGYWGRVEWAHDLNQQDLQTRLSAALLYIYYNTTSSTIQSKNPNAM